MGKKFRVEVTVPEGLKAGDMFLVEIEIPTPDKRPRGQLHGIALEDMNDEQLKREIVNSNSVLYKAKQRGASDEIIAANQLRLDAAKAEKAKREPEQTAVLTPTLAAAVVDVHPVASEPASEEVYDKDTAAEI